MNRDEKAMASSTLDTARIKVELNNTRLLLSAMLLVVIGMAVFIVQPGFVQGLVEYAGFSDKQAGYIVSAEMFGIALATIIMTVLASRINWHRICYGALVIVVTGNLISVTITDFEAFSSARFVIGIGSGALISLGYTIVGLTDNPDRNFGYLIVLVLVYSALVLLVMPLVYGLVGMSGMLVFFAILGVTGLFLVRNLPTSGEEHAGVQELGTVLSLNLRLLALTAILAYFLAQGVVWPYLFLIGTAGGGTEQQVATGLTISQFLGIAGAFTVALLGMRFNRIVILTLGTLGGVVPLMFLFGLMGALVYGIAVGVFNYAANVMTPLLFAIIAGLDRTGRMVVHAVALQMLGLAIGPSLAALVINTGDYSYSNVNLLSMLLFALSLACILPPVLARPVMAGLHRSDLER